MKLLSCTVRLAIALIGCAAQMPTTQADQFARAWFQEAQNREKKKFYQDAIDLYKQSMEMEPGSKLAKRAQQRINELRATPEMRAEEAKQAEQKRKKVEAQQAAKARLEAYVQAHPEYREAILAKKVGLGMSADDVIASWGKPDHVNTTVTAFGKHEQWVYGSTYLYFEEGVLASYQQSR
jgi:ATPase subunit of ABC transporter with duplicated ATPase domains